VVVVSPVDLRRGSRGADALIATVTAAIATVGVWQEVVNAPRPISLPAFAYLLAVAAALPLVWRRRHPVPVALACLAVVLGYHLAGYPGGAPAMSGFVAVFTVAAEGDGRRCLVVAIAIAVAVGVVTALPPHAVAVTDGAVYGPAAGFVLAAFVGQAIRGRTAELHDRVYRMDRQRTEEGLRRVAEERIRIARDLHDIVAHTVAVITVQAAVAADALDDRPEDTRRALAVIRQAARDATQELSTTVGVLRAGSESATSGPAPTPGLGDLDDLVCTLPALSVALRVEGEDRSLPRPVDNAAYRIVQEALTNVVKHARTTEVAIAITYCPEAVALTIVDHGVGCGSYGVDAPTGTPTGFGLIGMRERAGAVGGTVTAGPGTHDGFVVAARLPRQIPA